jgi:UDP-glucose 4-epimerase
VNILITGAGGFVCRHIVTALQDAGHGIIALDHHFDADLRANWQSDVALIEGGIDALPNAPVDVLIHGAAVTGSPEALGQSPMQNFHANLDPALTAMTWAADHAERAIFISSSAVYESAVYDRTAPGPIDESLPATPHGLYAVAKHTIERLVETYARDYGYNWTTIRLSNVFGPGEMPRSTRPRLSLIGHLIRGALIEGRITISIKEPARDWTLAPDIGRAVAALLNVPAWSHALYHLASEQRAAPAEIARLLERMIPGLRCDFVESLLSDHPPLTRLGYLANARLQNETHFAEWTSLEDGLRQTVDWQRAQLHQTQETAS